VSVVHLNRTTMGGPVSEKTAYLYREIILSCGAVGWLDTAARDKFFAEFRSRCRGWEAHYERWAASPVFGSDDLTSDPEKVTCLMCLAKEAP
jgi:hypothetical protein